MNYHETPNIPLKHTETTSNDFSKWHYDPKDDFKGGTALDHKKNWFVRAMRNKVVQVGVISSVKDKFKYAAYFDDNKFRANGRAIEYLLPQLKEGIVARKDLSVHSGTDFKRENEIPYVRVKKIMDHVYYDIIVEDRLLEGLINEGLLGDITDEIKYGISKKIRKDLGRAIEEEICNPDYYEIAKTDGKAGENKDYYQPEKPDNPGNWFIYPKTW